MFAVRNIFGGAFDFLVFDRVKFENSIEFKKDAREIKKNCHYIRKIRVQFKTAAG
jgi:hypothetical protein